MLSKFLATLVVASMTVWTAVAKPALPIPISGKYRIQNADTGFFMDDFQSNQATGTPVIVDLLNMPLTANQEWAVNVFEGAVAVFQSISSTINVVTNSNGQMVIILDDSATAEFTLLSVPGGVKICLVPASLGCLTSPSTIVAQIPVEPPVDGALNQTWIFQIVG